MQRALVISYIAFTVLLSSPQAHAQRSDRKTVKHLKADIGYLASDALEGRRTGSEGEHEAADYIIKRYQEEGVDAYKGQYRYPFNFVYGKEILPGTHIKLGNTTLKMNEDAFPLPFSASKKVYSEILPDVLEAGNIWLMPLYNSKDEADNPHFDWEKAMYKHCKEAKEQGATGVLFYDSYGSRYAPEFNKLSQYDALDIPVAFMTHTAYDKYIHDGAYEKLIKGNKTGLPVELNIEMKKADRTGTNLAAYIDNHAPYTVVIGAHYDHLGWGEDGNSLYAGKVPEIHNGADDNASGTAALVEMAGWIKKHKLHHYNYMFINFSGEELGLLGSKAFIKQESLDSTKVAYMINMDMVGRLNDSTHALIVGGVGTAPIWGKVLDKDNEDFKLKLDSSGIGPSDHTSFYLKGIPVLFFFTGTHSDYHKPTDDADKINYEGEAKVMRYIYAVVSDMDDAPKPEFHRTKEDAAGKVNFKVTLGIMPDYAFSGTGVRIDGVSDDRPASHAGLLPGDVIIKLGKYEVKGMQTYMEALSKFDHGDKTTVTILRKGEKQTYPLQFDK